MSMDFDDETIDDYDEEMAEGPEEPSFRVTVQRSGVVRLVHWGPWLQSSGPTYTLIASRERAGIAIADLRVVRDGHGTASEVIVEFISGGTDKHRVALVTWAHDVGYRRMWFDGEVVELEPTADGPVSTRCPGCGQKFIDGRSARFWKHVRHTGAFPAACALCGSYLPQWTPVRRADADPIERLMPTHSPQARAGKRAQRR